MVVKHGGDKSRMFSNTNTQKFNAHFRKNPGKLSNFFLLVQKLKSGMLTLEWVFSEVENMLKYLIFACTSVNSAVEFVVKLRDIFDKNFRKTGKKLE